MGWVTSIVHREQVEYRLSRGAGCGLSQDPGDRERPHTADVDRQVGYRLREGALALEWAGSGLREVGIEPGTQLTDGQKDLARALMDGVDPRTGEVLVAPKLAVDPRGMLPAGPLLDAVERAGGDAAFPASARWEAARFARLRRGAVRQGEAHRIPYRDADAVAKAAGVRLAELYGARVLGAARRYADHRVRVGLRGFDVTLDLPKSVSALWGLGDERLAGELARLHLEAVREGVAALEGWASYTMRGHHGERRAAERLESSGLLGWIMPHQVARPVQGQAPDPHVHAHVVIAHLGRTLQDGRWRTIGAGGREIHRHAHAVDALAKARFRALSAQRLGLRWARDGRTGAWEVVGIPEQLRAALSKRNAQVTELLRALGIAQATTFQEKSAAAISREAAATTGTGDDRDLREAWRAQAAGVLAPRSVEQVVRDAAPGGGAQARGGTGAGPHPPGPSVEELAAHLFDPERGLTAHRKVIRRADLIAAVLDALPGVDALATAQDLVDALIAGGHVRALPILEAAHLSNGERYTTPDIVAAERTITASARERYAEATATLLPAEAAALAISAFEAGRGFTLSPEQGRVVRRLLTAGHGVDAVIGVAGSGKTTLLAAARTGWEAAGLVVAGACTAAVACANLQAETGITTRTLASWLTRIETGAGLRGVDVLVLDEAAMNDDRQIARLMPAARAAGTKLVMLGDPMQLRSPGVGGAFTAIHAIVGGPTLTDNRRQRDEAERAALRTWRTGNRRAALGAWAKAGRVHAADDAAGALASMLTAWDQARARYPSPHQAIENLLLLAGTNQDAEQLNAGARAIRRAAGELGPEHTYRLAHGQHLQVAVGDLVMTRRNDYRAGRPHSPGADVLNGQRGVVTALDHTGVHIQTAPGARPVHLPAPYIAAGGLSHAYAMTVAKSQGLTAERALVYGAGLDAHTLYPAMSRQRDRADLWLPRTLLETDQTRARLGEPATPAEALARAIDAYATALQRTSEDIMVSVELGDEPPTQVRPAAPEPVRNPGRPYAALSDRQLAARITATIRARDTALTAAAHHGALARDAAEGRGPSGTDLTRRRTQLETATAQITAARPYTHALNTARAELAARTETREHAAAALAALKARTGLAALAARRRLPDAQVALDAADAALDTPAARVRAAETQLANHSTHLPPADEWPRIEAEHAYLTRAWPQLTAQALDRDSGHIAVDREQQALAHTRATTLQHALDALHAEQHHRNAISPAARDTENTAHRTTMPTPRHATPKPGLPTPAPRPDPAAPHRTR